MRESKAGSRRGLRETEFFPVFPRHPRDSRFHRTHPVPLRAERAITPASIPKTYAELRHAVEGALLKGQRAIERAKVLTYHETGRLINAHVLFNQQRAEYGSQVITRLARDLKADRGTLYQCTLFARFFPIVGARRKLTWAHYRRLVQIDDAKVRNALAAFCRMAKDALVASAPAYLRPDAQEQLLATPASCLAVIELAVNWEAEKLYGVEGLGPFDEF